QLDEREAATASGHFVVLRGRDCRRVVVRAFDALVGASNGRRSLILATLELQWLVCKFVDLLRRDELTVQESCLPSPKWTRAGPSGRSPGWPFPRHRDQRDFARGFGPGRVAPWPRRRPALEGADVVVGLLTVDTKPRAERACNHGGLPAS